MFSQHEYCLLCSSLNKLLVGECDHAWECWNCQSRWWLDDQARLEYQVHNNLNFEQAEADLTNRPYTGDYSNPQLVYEYPEIVNKNINFCMIESND